VCISVYKFLSVNQPKEKKEIKKKKKVSEYQQTYPINAAPEAKHQKETTDS